MTPRTVTALSLVAPLLLIAGCTSTDPGRVRGDTLPRTTAASPDPALSGAELPGGPWQELDPGPTVLDDRQNPCAGDWQPLIPSSDLLETQRVFYRSAELTVVLMATPVHDERAALEHVRSSVEPCFGTFGTSYDETADGPVERTAILAASAIPSTPDSIRYEGSGLAGDVVSAFVCTWRIVDGRLVNVWVNFVPWSPPSLDTLDAVAAAGFEAADRHLEP